MIKHFLNLKENALSVAKKFDIKKFYHCMLIYMRESDKIFEKKSY
jgi:hypothetical protein